MERGILSRSLKILEIKRDGMLEENDIIKQLQDKRRVKREKGLNNYHKSTNTTQEKERN